MDTGCFRVLAIINSAAVNIGAYVFNWMITHFPRDCNFQLSSVSQDKSRKLSNPPWGNHHMCPLHQQAGNLGRTAWSRGGRDGRADSKEPQTPPAVTTACFSAAAVCSRGGAGGSGRKGTEEPREEISTKKCWLAIPLEHTYKVLKAYVKAQSVSGERN